jgi:hypothetical protein
MEASLSRLVFHRAMAKEKKEKVAEWHLGGFSWEASALVIEGWRNIPSCLTTFKIASEYEVISLF